MTPSTPPTTLNEALDRAAELTAPGSETSAGLRVLDRYERPQWASWYEIRAKAARTASHLQTLGIAPGERVALIYPSGFPFFHAFFGILLCGAVPVPLYPPVRLGRLQEYHRRTADLLETVDARLVLTASAIRRLVGETVARARPQYGCLTLQELDSGPAETRSAETRSAETRSLATVGPDSLGLVQFSSGTTVEPKPVALTHQALLSQVRILNGLWPDGDETRHSGVSWLPLYHDMGLIGCVLPALERPATLTLLGPELFVARPSLWLRAISRYRATISPAPNFAFGLCVSKIEDSELEGVDLSSWRVALNGAEAVAPAVLEEFSRRFSRWGLRPEALTPVYGLSEASLAVTFSKLDRPFLIRSFDREDLASEGRAREVEGGLDLVSVGRPLAGFEVRVRDRERRELLPGRVGRIWVRGPSLMEGYLNRPEATRQVLDGEWLDTGDQGFVYDHELYLTGRAKDLLILRGRNYSPESVEGAVDGIAGVRKGCVVALSFAPEGAWEEELVVLLERARGGRKREAELARLGQEIRQRVLGETGLNPSRVVVLEPGSLPRTSSGKLRRGEARRRYQVGELHPPEKMGALKLAQVALRSRRALKGIGGSRADRAKVGNEGP